MSVAENREVLNPASMPYQELDGVYDEHVPAIIRRLQRRFPSVDAEEYAQQAICDALPHFQDFQVSDKKNLGGWLYTIAHNLVLDHLRSVRGRHEARQVPIDEASLLSTNTPLDQMITNETISDVRHAVSILPPQQQAVIVLKYQQGLTNSIVAGKLFITEGSVKSAQNRALNNMKNVLEYSK